MINFLVTELIIILPALSKLMNIHAFLSSSAAYDKSSLSPERFPNQSQNFISMIAAPG
jgi:hypothetical protein